MLLWLLLWLLMLLTSVASRATAVVAVIVLRTFRNTVAGASARVVGGRTVSVGRGVVTVKLLFLCAAAAGRHV